LTSVTYLGKGINCDISVFGGCRNLLSACVTFDFRNDMLCGVQAFSDASSFKDLKKSHNHCYQVVMCNNTYAYARKRENATMWEKDIGCFDLSCNNNSGKVIDTPCDKKSSYVCIGSKCEVLKDVAQGKTVVKIEVSDLDSYIFNSTNIALDIESDSDVDSDKFKVGIRVDDEGQVTLFLIVDDEESAKTIVNNVESCIHSSNYYFDCSYLIEYIKSAKILSESEISEDAASHSQGTFIIILSFMILSITSTMMF